MKKSPLLFAVAVFFLAGTGVPAQTEPQENFGTLTLPEGWAVQLRAADLATTQAAPRDDDDEGEAFDATFTISDSAGNTLVYSFRVVEVQDQLFIGTRTHVAGALTLHLAQSGGDDDDGDSAEVDVRYQTGFGEITRRSLESFEDWRELALTLQARTDLASRIEGGLEALRSLDLSLGLQAAIAPTVLLILEPDTLHSVDEDQVFDLLPLYPGLFVYSRIEVSPAVTTEIECPNPDGSVDVYEISNGVDHPLGKCGHILHRDVVAGGTDRVLGGWCAAPGGHFVGLCCVCPNPCTGVEATGASKCRHVKTKPKQGGSPKE